MNNAVIQVKDLTFSYNKIEVLKDINFSIEENDYVAIVGPNGSGKTTLVKLLLNIIKTNGDSIKINQNIADNKEISYVSQQVYSHHKRFPITVFELVQMGLYNSDKLFNFYSKSDTDKVIAILEELNIQDLRDMQVNSLSGGQRQKVLLARSIINNPKILILDEPTSALDPEFRLEFYELIEKLNKEGMTIIIVSHDLGALSNYINKVMYIDHSIKYYGSIDDYKNFEREYGEVQ